MRTAVYARYSSDKQRESSIDDQVRNCTAFADREGWSIVKHYSDEALPWPAMETSWPTWRRP